MKKVAIMGWSQGQNSYGVGKAYLELITSLGAVPVIMTPELFCTPHGVNEERVVEFFEGIDLLLMSGGADVDPSRYGAVPGYYTQNSNLMLEWFDKHVLPIFIAKTKVPAFGICRGMQSLSVEFGATMTQNAWHPYSDKSRSELVEKIVFAPGVTSDDLPAVLTWTTPQKKNPNQLVTRNANNQEINSLHHQHANLKSFDNTQLDCWFISAMTGTPEVVASKDQRFVGVQYHPEEIYDTQALAALNNLLHGVPENFSSGQEEVAAKQEETVQSAE